uniref:Uncharacterized protein n=1 Tax=Anolis carolinensis TaxID=28377 RepID=A0A803TP35_ANOCA
MISPFWPSSGSLRLLLAVQRLGEHQLGEAVAVGLRLHVEREEGVGGDLVGAQRVGAHVGVEGALQREARARRGALGDLHRQVGLREGGRVVVEVQHLHLHAEELQRVLQEDLQVELAGGALPADLLAVDLLAHVQHPGLQVEVQVRAARVGHRLEAPRGKFGDVQAQVLGDVAHESAMLLLLLHGVVKLRQGPRPHPDEGQGQE